MRKIFLQPVLHFILIGLALYSGEQYFQWRSDFQIDVPSDEELSVIYQRWHQKTGKVADAEQRKIIADSEITERILLAEAFRRGYHLNDEIVAQRLIRNANFLGIEGDEEDKIATALELNLHKNDEVVRRRLIQRMESIGRSYRASKTVIHAEEIQQYYADNPEKWQQEAKIKIQHVFFSSDVGDPEARLAEAKKRLNSADVATVFAADIGDPFLLGTVFPLQSIERLQLTMGSDFVRNLLKEFPTHQLAGEGEWFGPIVSGYGLHLVNVLAYEPPFSLALEQVVDEIRNELIAEREVRALLEFVSVLKQRYKTKDDRS